MKMKTIREVVLEQHTKVMKKNGINKESCEDMSFGRTNSIDSLGIVELIVGIEEELGVELDGCLAFIRRCKSVGELIEIIENYINR